MADQTRVCHTGRYARVASAFPHFGEEDCLRGWRGSGTIFFSLWNLRCVFCQNWDISHRMMGQYRPEYEVGQIAGDGFVPKYAEIDQQPARDELEQARAAARWRHHDLGFCNALSA
jgi:uncharacterized Fe-S radical SAM superfamily protein PflX